MNEKEIKKFEEQGFSVVSINSIGKLEYATEKENSDDFCDSCEHLRFAPDPDPDDWFRGDDQKAICMAKKVVMYHSLMYNELTQIPKPLYCPKLKRELTDEEELIAMRQLEADRLN